MSYRIFVNRSFAVIKTFCFILFAVFLIVYLDKTVSAGQLLDRSIVVSSSAPSAVASNDYKFTIQNSVTVGSIIFEYCSNSPIFNESCDAPLGLDVSSASLSTQLGVSGFSIYSSSANKIVIGRIPAAITSPVIAEYTFNGVINPSENNKTIYIRISTFASNDGTGTMDENGAVAFSTSSGLGVGGYVPPYLSFCVGITVSSDCSTATGSYQSFGEFSTTVTKTLSSQFGVATNDSVGYIASLSGLTMTSGNNTITADGFTSLNNPGSSQFGLNLRANTNPFVGADKTGIGTGTVSPDFDNANQFVFKNGTIAYSNLPSEFNVFTASYIVNISDGQPAGVYTTTLTYIATVQF